MDDDLEARLASHAQAFEGLLSLIPAKQYYGEDTSDQWQRKKQTKEQKRAAKRAKLDPANQKSAKDVMDENEKKRKRELGIDSADEGDQDLQLDIEKEQPGQGRKVKKQKTDKDGVTAQSQAEDVIRAKAKAEKRKEKRDKKKEKVERNKEKVEAKKARKQGVDLQDAQAAPSNGLKVHDVQDQHTNEDVTDGEEDQAVDLGGLDVSGLADDDSEAFVSQQSSTPISPILDSLAFDTSANQSAASSSSSIVPPATAPAAAKKPETTSDGVADQKPKKDKALNLPKVDPEELQARLRARIEELRARRKADGPDGRPAQSRQELLDSRRKKSEARKQHKKELRLKAKQEEERQNNERLQGSGSPLSADIFSPRSPMAENNFSFGRVAFEDGQQADATLGSLSDARKKKGPQDPKTALEAAQRKAARLDGYDADKRQEIEDKDVWLNAKKRAHGERVRDDQSLLKKALKRKEKGKAKSEREWNERLDGVKKGQEVRQKKREGNLAKRRDDKGTKKSKSKPVKASKGKKKGRPGFEGNF